MLQKTNLTSCSPPSGIYSGSHSIVFATFYFTVSFEAENMLVCTKTTGFSASGPFTCAVPYTFDQDSCTFTLADFANNDCLNNVGHTSTDNYVQALEYLNDKDSWHMTTHSPHTPGMGQVDYELAKVDKDPLECGAPEIKTVV